AHPIHQKTGSLEREKVQLEAMLKKERQSQTELTEWQQKTQERIPVLRDELKNKMEGIIGRTVQYSDVFPTSA
ncbi:MAG: hypothetical protein M0Q92_16340, partial [Methanoregula sp.]|nr:hypothetical protein [Methanoregula sp.]